MWIVMDDLAEQQRKGNGMDLHKIAEKADQRLSKRFNYAVTDIERDLSRLLHGNSVEVGKRTSCGKTDATVYSYREWISIIKKIQSCGYSISIAPVKHKNAYATSKGGFWSSEIYEIQADPQPPAGSP